LEESRIVEGRNAVLEAFRSGKTIDKLFVLEGCKDGPIQTILREAKKSKDTVISFVKKERLDQLSETGKHQGVLAYAASYDYVELDEIMARAKEKGEAPFLIILDNIEDPHNLGAIIRTANQVGAHGVVIPKHRAVGLTATVAKASAGAINYTPVAKVTNISKTMEELKEQGIDVSVVSMPCMDLFDRQSEEYKESVLPKAVRARVAVEALSDFGWGKYVGLDGAYVTMHGFGASAPAGVLFEKIGITKDAAVKAMKGIL
jgi:23S rRNA (guanosine2251-2'-O)-methyltransferase